MKPVWSVLAVLGAMALALGGCETIAGPMQIAGVNPFQ